MIIKAIKRLLDWTLNSILSPGIWFFDASKGRIWTRSIDNFLSCIGILPRNWIWSIEFRAGKVHRYIESCLLTLCLRIFLLFCKSAFSTCLDRENKNWFSLQRAFCICPMHICSWGEICVARVYGAWSACSLVKHELPLARVSEPTD